MEDKEFIFKQLDNKIKINNNEVIDLDIDKISDYLKGMFSVDGWEYLHYWCKSRIGDTYVINLINGDKRWYKNGLNHRDGDKPAVMLSSGSKLWYQNDLRHRDNNKPAVIWPDGTKIWWENNKLIKLT